jgi:predicted AlkP superfamily pyrophosphatase or phosphodiesterase
MLPTPGRTPRPSYSSIVNLQSSMGMLYPMRLSALFTALLALLLSPVDGPRAQERAVSPADIRLVLLVAVDQFRYDYLTRFRAEYAGGFSKLLTHGATFTQAYLDHYPCVTAVGHATMLSGAIPAVSGIIGNDWYDRTLGATVTSVSDPQTQLVGGAGEGSSPRRLLVSTLGDEMKNAVAHLPAEATPKVFGLSL